MDGANDVLIDFVSQKTECQSQGMDKFTHALNKCD